MKILCAKYNNMKRLHPTQCTTCSVATACYLQSASQGGGELGYMLCKNIMLIPYNYTKQYLVYLSLQTLQQTLNNCMGYTYTHIQFSTRGLFRGAREGFLGFQKPQNSLLVIGTTIDHHPGIYRSMKQFYMCFTLIGSTY